jgi:hypothetical protein
VGILENDFENLGIVLYSTEMFSGKKYVLKNERRRELVDLWKKALVVLCSRSEQLTRTTTITLVWDGA